MIANYSKPVTAGSPAASVVPKNPAMAGEIIAAIIAGVSALASTGISAGVQASQNKKARDYEQAQINAQNLYNSPASQMARYQAAGLNPHLIYGQGSSGLQQSTVSPKFDIETDYSQGIQQALQMYFQAAANSRADKALALDGMRTEATVDKMLSDIRQREADIKLKEQQANNLTVDAALKQYKLRSILPYQSRFLSEQVLKMSNYNSLFDLQRQNLKSRNDLMSYQLNFLNPANLRLTNQKNRLLSSQADISEQDYYWYKKLGIKDGPGVLYKAGGNLLSMLFKFMRKSKGMPLHYKYHGYNPRQGIVPNYSAWE
nr:MAG: DNA pilot protein [Microvirus sp.]